MAARRGTQEGAGPRTPWYADGLRFTCQPDCGACCTNHENYAYVYLREDDFEALHTFLGLDADTFANRYTELEEGYLTLRMDDPACPFLEGSRCTVYPVRPVQCRTFPFWPEILANRRSWERLRRFCPGIGVGERHSLTAIRDQLVQIGDDPT